MHELMAEPARVFFVMAGIRESEKESGKDE